MEDLELTASEKEIIRINREKEVLAKQERVAKRIQKNEKLLGELPNTIKIFLDKEEKKNKFVQDSFAELDKKHPGLYKLHDSTLIKDFEVFDQYTLDELRDFNIDCGDSRFCKNVILKEESVEYTNCYIKRCDTKFTICANEHTVRGKGGKGYGSRNTTELKLFTCNIDYDNDRKALKNVMTAHKNIQDCIDTTNYKNEQERLEAEGFELLKKELETEYANDDVTIEFKNEYISRGRHDTGYHKNLMVVTFKNGLVVKYSHQYYKNGDNMVFKSYIYEFPHIEKLNKQSVINALKNVK